jgi:predicted dehydrogenase
LNKFADDNHGGVEANCVVEVICSANGVRIPGLITLSKTHRLANRLRITGEKGALEAREGESSYVTFFPAGEETQHKITPADDRSGSVDVDYFKVQLEDFVRAIRMRAKPKIDGHSGSASVAFTDKCYESATRLEEPWVYSTLDQLRTALPDHMRKPVSPRLDGTQVK